MKPLVSVRSAMAGISLLLLTACGSGEPPRAELGAADAAIQAAQRSGAAERAPVELNNARVKYDAANVAVRDEEYDRAARLAREAEIDAQLAAAKAQAEASRTAARQVHEGTITLQRETAPLAPVPQGPPVTITPQTRPVQ
jgi:hypothetical protein